MLYDTLYRHNQALSPAGLEHLPAALHALNAAVDDCQRAGKPVAGDAAILLLIRHLAHVAERDTPSVNVLRLRCEADRLAAAAAPALLDIAGKSVGGNDHAKRTFHYQARRALARLATAIGLDADDALPDSEVSIIRCRDGQEVGKSHRAPIAELLDVAAFQRRLAGTPVDIGAVRLAAAA